ncbi:divergent protein kinase domain 1A [Hyalella azteca]|uniref:Divergent protein kinase domain 1A n=1 Tax=Hyalella azteca TaxID=294128 RepID=A0A979FUN0_HYAAZ|nr:divergent protein kinase domain 1A [Hyalella azteca]
MHKKCQDIKENGLDNNYILTNGTNAKHVNLCHELCSSDISSRIECHGPQLSKAAVFTLLLHKKNRKNPTTPVLHHLSWPRIVIKSSASNSFQEIGGSDQMYWQTTDQPLPSREDLMHEVLNYVQQSISVEEMDPLVTSLLQQVPLFTSNNKLNSRLAHKYLWTLIKDREFLMTLALEDLNIFPRLLGTCGDFYGVEHVNTLKESFITPFSLSRDERLSKAIHIIQFIEKLHSIWREPLHLCDVKMTHFGWNSVGIVKFVDVDTVMPHSSLIERLQLVPKCEFDEDCAFFDCAAKCNSHLGICEPKRTNTNLQVVCKKIFLGETVSGVQLQGLLQLNNELEKDDSLREAITMCITSPDMTTQSLLHALHKAQDVHGF